MPRQARLDHPGLLHHVMARGLNRQRIFTGATDLDDFVARIGFSLQRSPSEILAWALMPNHFHLLIRSGAQGLGSFMRRLSTGYAIAFNRRHKRSGYLFQGRYKSLVCDEEDYLMTLVRYIHLNPVSGQVVRSIEALKTYPYTGHSVLMGKQTQAWQEVDDVLGRFGQQAGAARRRYEMYLKDGLPEVRRQPTDLLGGGLLEGLQETARRYRREGDRELQDDRILGESDFVSRVWKEADQQETLQKQLARKKLDIRAVAKVIAKAYDVDDRRLFERGRTAAVSKAKAALIYIGVEGLGKSIAEMARWTRMTGVAAGKAKDRGAIVRGTVGNGKLVSLLRP